jgi:hypothetical protein
LEKDRKLAGDSNDCSFLRRFAANGVCKAPPAEIGVRASEPENVVGAVYEKLPEVLVASLGDAKLGRSLPRLSLLGNKTKVGPDLAALGKSVWVTDGEHEGESDQRSNAGDLSQDSGLRITLLAQFLDAVIRFSDLGRQATDHGKQRLERRLQLLRYR